MWCRNFGAMPRGKRELKKHQKKSTATCGVRGCRAHPHAQALVDRQHPIPGRWRLSRSASVGRREQACAQQANAGQCMQPTAGPMHAARTRQERGSRGGRVVLILLVRYMRACTLMCRLFWNACLLAGCICRRRGCLLPLPFDIAHFKTSLALVKFR